MPAVGAALQEALFEREVGLVDGDEQAIVQLNAPGMMRRRMRFSAMHSTALCWSVTA
jgi:hypothetical protein